MGAFDDLVPSEGPAAAAPQKGVFDDLVPAQAQASSAPQVGAPSGGWAPPTPQPTASFADLIPTDTPPKTRETAQGIDNAVRQETSLSTLGGDVVRSAHQLKRGSRAGMYMLGLDDDVDGLANMLAESSAIDAQYPKSKERAALDQELALQKAKNDNAFWSTLGDTVTTLAKHPKGTASMFLENSASMVAPLAGAVAGGAAGSVVPVVGTGIGAYAGLAAGSGFIDYGSSFEEYIKEKRNPVTAADWKTALLDKDLVNEAHWYAAKHSGAVAAFDVIGAKGGGSIAARYFVPGTSVGKKFAAAGAGVGVDALSEGAGEATGQYWGKGKVDWQDAVLEGALGSLGSAPNIMIEPLSRHGIRSSTPAPVDPLAELGVTTPPAATGVVPEVPSVPAVEKGTGTEQSLPPEQKAASQSTPARQIEVMDEPRQKNPADPMDDELIGNLKLVDPEFNVVVGDIGYDEFTSDTGAKGVIPRVAPESISSLNMDVAATRFVDWMEENGYKDLSSQGGITDPMFSNAVLREIKNRGGTVKGDREGNYAARLGSDFTRTPQISEMTGQPDPDMRSEDHQGVRIYTVDAGKDVTGARTQAAFEISKGVIAVANRFGIGKNKLRYIQIVNNPGWDYRGEAEVNALDARNKRYNITLNIGHGALTTPQQIYGVAMHELGHVIMWDKFNSATASTKIAVRQAYNIWKSRNPETSSFIQMKMNRDSYTNVYREIGRTDSYMSQPYGDMSLEERLYWAGFEEWFAEQVARWATTDARPIGVVQKFFKDLAQHLLRAYRVLFNAGQRDFDPSMAMKEFLNSIYEGGNYGKQFKDMMAEVDRATKKSNQRLISADSPQVEAAPRQVENMGFETASKKLFSKGVPPQVQNGLAWADKFNSIYKYGLTLVQVAKRNLHIGDLQRYVETMRAMHLEEHKVQEAALRVSKAWKDLKGDQGGRVGGLIDDVVNMVYLTDDERKNNTVRMPTPKEMADLVDKWKVSKEGQAVFDSVQKMFSGFLALNEQNLYAEAAKIVDPVRRAEAMDNIRAKFEAMRKRPYFPAMRFGDHSLTVRDKNGNVTYFETVEGSSINPLRSARRRQLQRRDEIAKEMGIPKEEVLMGVIPKDARPFMGMPGPLLDLIGEKLDLSDTQRDMLDQLKYELSPAQSFKHRFQRKRNIEGYSLDFQRAFAHYFFHGAKYYSRVKFATPLKEYIKSIGDQAKFMPDGRKRMQIRNFLDDHYNNVLDPKPDWAALRGIMFLWALGFSPAAATLNLTQLPLGTFPFLASKFGDAKAIAAMTRAGTKLSTFYKRGKYDGATDFEFRALSEGIKQGTVTEAMAPELAATAEGRNLGYGFGGNAAQKTWQKFQEYAGKMFELTEQTNRRITFRAGLSLGWENYNSKHVNQLVVDNQLEYKRLTDSLQDGGKGWSDREARAFLTASDAVNTTQYEYARWARPRMFRGKLATLFVFKTFTQNTLFFLWNYPSAAVRYGLIMAFLGGLMGIPGAEDADDIIKAIAWQIFGKDFDIENEARKLVLDLSNEKIPPDLLLHGMARRGFGIPTILDMLGNTVGRGDFETTFQRFLQGRTPEGKTAAVPAPMLDRSRAVGQGRILPVELGKMFGPTKDNRSVIADQAQNAAGAAFGVGFNIYKAMTDTQLSAGDMKRWERAVPRFMASASRSYRAFSEGRERNRSGSTTVNYNIKDTEQMMEALALLGGYNNVRNSSYWDRVMAEREAISFWNLRKTGLLKQYYEATGNEAQRKQVWGAIQKYNSDLPKEAADMKIKQETIDRSMKARERNRAAQESGEAVQKSTRGLQKSIQRLYPESAIDVRKVN